MSPHDNPLVTSEKADAIVSFSEVCGSLSPYSLDLEVEAQHTQEFSEWKSQDHCIYHGNTELSSRTAYLSSKAQR